MLTNLVMLQRSWLDDRNGIQPVENLLKLRPKNPFGSFG